MQQGDQTAKLITMAAYAKSRGLNRSTISREVQRGLIPVHGERRMVDPDEADRQRAECLSPIKGAKRGLRAGEALMHMDPELTSIPADAVVTASVTVEVTHLGQTAKFGWDSSGPAIGACRWVDWVVRTKIKKQIQNLGII